MLIELPSSKNILLTKCEAIAVVMTIGSTEGVNSLTLEYDCPLLSLIVVLGRSSRCLSRGCEVARLLCHLSLSLLTGINSQVLQPRLPSIYFFL